MAREEKRSEVERLQAEIERYRSLFRATETAWALHEMLFDDAGRPTDYVFLDVNPAFERDTGLTAEACVGKRVTDIIPGIREAKPDLIATYGEVVQTGKPVHFELHFEPLDRWYRITAARPYEGHFIAAFEDISARHRAEERLFASEERFHGTFEAAPDYCYMVAPDGAILDVNTAALTALGYAKEELVGRPVAALYPPEVGDRVRTLLEWWRRTGSIDNEEITLVTKSGERRVVLLSVSSVRDRAGVLQHSVSIQRDITERTRMEELLARTAAELVRSNQELEQFAYVASHDLQEPLRMVASFVRLLGDRYRGRLDDEADTFIGFAEDGARRMQAMIMDLLTYSRVGSRSTSEATETSACLEEALRNLEGRLEESGASVGRGELPRLDADPRQLAQLFQNLVGNALKFRKPGVPPEVFIDAHREGDEWTFEVRDNGIGIAPRFYERVFEIFQRLHSRDEYEGTGLGLALCRRIVERHGGRIWLAGVEGEGTTVRFTLPA